MSGKAAALPHRHGPLPVPAAVEPAAAEQKGVGSVGIKRDWRRTVVVLAISLAPAEAQCQRLQQSVRR
jgi:hypothetical protein